MYLFSRIGNFKTIRVYQYIMIPGQFPGFVMQLPGNLHYSWPVIYFTNKRVVSFGETCCLGVEY